VSAPRIINDLQLREALMTRIKAQAAEICSPTTMCEPWAQILIGEVAANLAAYRRLDEAIKHRESLEIEAAAA
jgi:hypothetical protein